MDFMRVECQSGESEERDGGLYQGASVSVPFGGDGRDGIRRSQVGG